MTPALPAVWDPGYEVDIGVHVFPTVKYRLAKERLVEEGTLRAPDIRRPAPASREELVRIHTPAFLDRALQVRLSGEEVRDLELPFSRDVLRFFLLACGGTTLAARIALAEGLAVHLGGGFHHGFPDRPEGFCLLNDVAVAAAAVRAEGGVERVAVIDLDVHHGNGTAAIFQSVPEVFTFSMHQERNYPAVKPEGDLDVGLPDGIQDEEYLELLGGHLPQALDEHGPGLVFYLAGADPFVEDQLGGLRLTKAGLRERDRAVLSRCRGLGIPVVVLLAGGYALRLDDTVEIHCNTVREARALLGD